MHYLGIDVYKKESHVAVLDDGVETHSTPYDFVSRPVSTDMVVGGRESVTSECHEKVSTRPDLGVSPGKRH
jgi:hypothetical protein